MWYRIVRSSVNSELKSLWKDAVVTYFKAFSRSFPGGNERGRQNFGETRQSLARDMHERTKECIIDDCKLQPQILLHGFKRCYMGLTWVTFSTVTQGFYKIVHAS
jgi:hypothetical protein